MSSNAGMGSNAEALAQFNGIAPPSIHDQELSLLGPQYAGDYQSQLEASLGLGPSAMEGVSTDPRLEQAQMAALDNLSQIGEVGMTPGEAAALRQVHRGAAAEAQAKSAQLMDEYARRGMGGSGAELAARLQASQSGADRQSAESDREMQAAQQRALEAIGQSAGLAGNMRNQSFGEQSDVAKAKDYINQFNTQNQQGVQQRNVSAANQAALRNLSEKQRIGEASTNIQNQQQQYNKNLAQQQFQNRLQLAGARSGAYQAQAEAERKRAAAQGNMYGGLIQGGGTLAGAAIGGAPGAAVGSTVGGAAGGMASGGQYRAQPINPYGFVTPQDDKEYDFEDFK